MKYEYLGKSGLLVSKLCLGTRNFGEHIDEEASFQIMDRAYELGLNFWDCADCYGGWDGTGDTETIVGKWFAKNPNKRDEIVMSTKVWMNMPGDKEWDIEPLFSGHINGYRVRKHLEASLRRLQTDHIDLYIIHHNDRAAHWDDVWASMQAAYNQGKIIYCGTSNFAARDLVEAQAAAEKRQFFGIVSEQHKYNLLTRQAELEVLPAAKRMEIGIMLYSPLEGGLLGGHALTPGRSGRSAAAAKNLNEAQIAQLRAYSILCKELGEPEAIVAIAWELRNPAVTSPIVGPRNVAQLEETLRAVELELPDDFCKKIDEIFPGPGAEAPRAYSW